MRKLGWRAAFWVPSLILFPMAMVFFVFLRNSPEDAGFPPVRDDGLEPVRRGPNEQGPPGRRPAFHARICG